MPLMSVRDMSCRLETRPALQQMPCQPELQQSEVEFQGERLAGLPSLSLRRRKVSLSWVPHSRSCAREGSIKYPQLEGWPCNAESPWALFWKGKPQYLTIWM